MLESLEEKVDPKHAALVVVDVQNHFCHSEGFLAKQGRDLSHTHQMIPKLIRLISEARTNKLKIVFIRQTRSDWTMSPVSREQRRRIFPGASENTLLEGSWAAKFYEVTPQPDECIVTKHRASAFVDTDLNLILRSRGIKSLIMTGVATNVCVESTARDGFMKDYYIVFVSDSTATEHIEDHEATLRNIHTFFGVVATSDEVINAWRKGK